MATPNRINVPKTQINEYLNNLFGEGLIKTFIRKTTTRKKFAKTARELES